MSGIQCQFKAGRAHRRSDDSKWVDPQEGRGLVYLKEEGDLLHFYYKNLATGSTEEEAGGLDLLVFPGDATFSLLPSTRIAVLKFHSSSHRHFFWPQDVDASNDAELVRKINELIGGSAEEEEEEVTAAEGTMEVEGPTASTSAPSQSLASNFGSITQMDQLSALVSSFQNSAAGGSSSARGGAQRNPYEQQTPEYLLPDVLPPTLLLSLLQTTPSLVPILLPFLPSEVPQTPETLQVALGSPEFRRSLASLDRALRTGALGPLVVGLGLEESAAMGVEAFLEAIIRQAGEE